MLTLRMDHIGDVAIIECKGRIVRSDATLKLHESSRPATARLRFGSEEAPDGD